MGMITTYEKCPRKKGKLCIFPSIEHGKILNVRIVGDRKGLQYLASLANYLADLNLDKLNMPKGGRAHLHLKPELHMGWNSCNVEICRAEAKGTQALPSFMDD
jgi:hypothetical protein